MRTTSFGSGPKANQRSVILLSRITDNSIPATAFKAMKAARAPGEREENETQKGLRVSDKGFLNTAVIQSEITFIDGDAGGMCSFICGSDLYKSNTVLASSSVQVSRDGSFWTALLIGIHRGYPIEQLALHSSHLETGTYHDTYLSYLLMSHHLQHIFSSTALCPRKHNTRYSRQKSCIIVSLIPTRSNSSVLSGTYINLYLS